MTKKQTEIVIREEQVELNFYAVRSQDGKWFRNKGMSGRSSWVDNISKARIYATSGPAKTQVTFWAQHYPQFGIPELVKISSGICQFIDQTDRVSKTISDKAIKEKKRVIENNIRRLQHSINDIKKVDVEKLKDTLKKEMDKLNNLLN